MYLVIDFQIESIYLNDNDSAKYIFLKEIFHKRELRIKIYGLRVVKEDRCLSFSFLFTKMSYFDEFLKNLA